MGHAHAQAAYAQGSAGGSRPAPGMAGGSVPAAAPVAAMEPPVQPAPVMPASPVSMENRRSAAAARYGKIAQTLQ